MTSPLTPAEIETLRDTLNKHVEDRPELNAAVAILNRLSPPAPEVDEATVWTRKVLHAHQRAMTPPDSGWGNMSYEKGSYDHLDVFKAPCQVLSELIASKDAEIAKAQLWAMEQHKCADEYASELAALRAENERLKGDVLPPDGYKNLHIAARDCIFDANGLGRIEDGWLLLESVNVSVTSKAAERNTAEPATDTAPVVEVTVDGGMDAEAVEQAELLWAQLPVIRKWTSIPTHEKALVCHLLSTYRTEAEARGRREALENAIEIATQQGDDEWSGSNPGCMKSCIDIADKLKRLMTEGK